MIRIKRAAFISLGLVFLTGAQAGEIWKGGQQLSESQGIDLLATAIGDLEHVKGEPLAGCVFRNFHDSEFYTLVRKADEKRSGRELSEVEVRDWRVKINFDKAIFENVKLKWLAMPGGKFNQGRFSDVVFDDCTLTDTDFARSEFRGAWFLTCDLKKASFNGEDRSPEAREKHALARRSTNSSVVSFNDSDLAGCDFRFSSMKNVEFLRCSLSKCEMAWATFDSTKYDPLPNSLPFLPSFGTFWGLPDFSYQESPTGMTELRNAFKSGGLRREERQITTALCRQQMRDGGKWEGRWKRLLFDLPSAFGMHPGRPLRILLCLCGVFALPYTWAILRQAPVPGKTVSGKGEGRIWQVPLERRVAGGDSKPRLLHVDLKQPGRFRGLGRALSLGFFFSVISAFGVGYRDLDVGRWIERINPDESTLQATGWLRTVSGVQGLMSFYLLALWLLTYFGRPFE